MAPVEPKPAATSALTVSSPEVIPTAAAPVLYDVGRIFCRIATTLAFDLKVFGLHHVPKRGGVLLLSNHQSYLDPVLVAVRLPRPLSFMARSDLFDHPALSWLIRNLNAFPIRRGASDVGAMRETITRLQQGHALVVFAEGTRTLDGEIQPLQSGFALIARKVTVPIVPVTVDGAFQAWGKGQRIKPHPIRVSFGPPLQLRGLRPAAIVTHAERTLREQLNQLRAMPR